MLPQVPELADGGFWYVVPALMTEDGVLSVPEIFGGNWIADYADVDGTIMAYVRTTTPVIVEESALSPSTVIALTGAPAKPFGRTSGG